MGNYDKPIPAGTNGIIMRSAQLQEAKRSRVPSQHPLDASQIWQQVVQPKRGFEARPFDKNDRYRSTPSAPLGDRLNEGVRGGKVGFGVDTMGAVQITDATGKQSWVAVGHYMGGGPENHAEARSLEGLRMQAPKRLEGSRVTVVVDQLVCPTCREGLNTYAKEVGADTIEIYHPHMENEATKFGSGIMSSPKTSSTGSFRAQKFPDDIERQRPPLSVRLEETIKLKRPPRGGPPAGSGFPPGLSPLENTHVRTAISGAVLHLAGSEALGIFQEKFKAYMLSELEHMPKPSLNNAKEFFSNRHTGKAIQVIDVLTKNVDPFSMELAEHHKNVLVPAVLELTLLRVSEVSDIEKLEYLTGLQEELLRYDDSLRVAEDNLEAAQRISPGAEESARTAEDLAKVLDPKLLMDALVYQGFDPYEVLDMPAKLTHYASRVCNAFRRLEMLRAQVTRQRKELAVLADDANRIYWQTIFALAARGQDVPSHSLPRPQGPVSGGAALDVPKEHAAVSQSKTAPKLKPNKITVSPLR